VAELILTEDQRRRIRLAKSSLEITEIVNETKDARAEQVAQTEAEAEPVKKKRYVSVDGFLQEY